jgi:hypothetical protein
MTSFIHRDGIVNRRRFFGTGAALATLGLSRLAPAMPVPQRESISMTKPDRYDGLRFLHRVPAVRDVFVSLMPAPAPGISFELLREAVATDVATRIFVPARSFSTNTEFNDVDRQLLYRIDSDVAYSMAYWMTLQEPRTAQIPGGPAFFFSERVSITLYAEASRQHLIVSATRDPADQTRA